MIALYGYIAAGGLALLAVVGGVGYHYGAKHAEDRAMLDMNNHLAADEKAVSSRAAEVRVLEQELAEAQIAVSEVYEKGKRDAENTATAVVDDLRRGNLRLQRRWESCAANSLPGAASATSEPDAGAQDRGESASRIVRAAAESDAQVRGLQELLMLERRGNK